MINPFAMLFSESGQRVLSASFPYWLVGGVSLVASVLFLWPSFSIVRAADQAAPQAASEHSSVAMPRVTLTDDEWRKILTDEQFEVLRRAGTEKAFDNRYFNFQGHGCFACVACGNRLFSTSAKYDSGTGWPTFSKSLDDAVVTERADDSHGMHRTEVICSRCDGHLGHVFNDGPPPTGLRYCMNSAALTFFPDKHANEHAP